MGSLVVEVSEWRSSCYLFHSEEQNGGKDFLFDLPLLLIELIIRRNRAKVVLSLSSIKFTISPCVAGERTGLCDKCWLLWNLSLLEPCCCGRRGFIWGWFCSFGVSLGRQPGIHILRMEEVVQHWAFPENNFTPTALRILIFRSIGPSGYPTLLVKTPWIYTLTNVLATPSGYPLLERCLPPGYHIFYLKNTTNASKDKIIP